MAKIKGLNKLNSNLNNVTKHALVSSDASMRKSLLLIKNNAQKRTPVDTGLLRSSASIKIDYKGARGVIGYVYYTPNYALYVHEILTTFHPVGEAKFLWNAAMSMKEEILNIFFSGLSEVTN